MARSLSVLLLVAVAVAFVAAQQPVNDGRVTMTVTDADDVLADVNKTQMWYESLEQRQQQADRDIQNYWRVFNAVVILFMQAGFALYEAGVVRPVCQGSAFFKVALTFATAAIVWWVFGFAVAFGESFDEDTRNGFIGNGDFILVSEEPTAEKYVRWFHELSYALVPTTIVLMALAERVKTVGIILVTVIISGFVYPVVAHWGWSQAGFLSPYATNIDSRMGDQGMLDFAGSGVIFLVAGSAGLAATLAAGPRTNRFELPEQFAARNKALITSGAFIIITSFVAFAVGRAANFGIAGKVTINVFLALAGGFFGGFPISYFRLDRVNPDVTIVSDSLFAGFAAGASGFAVVEPWAALVTGFIGGLFFAVFRGLISGSRVDDTFHSFATFGFPGIWGLFATGFLATRKATVLQYGDFNIGAEHSTDYGLFYQGEGQVLWANLVSGIIIFWWSFVVTFVLVKIVALVNLLRLEEEDEVFGSDLSHFTEFEAADPISDAHTDVWTHKLVTKEVVTEETEPTA